MQQRAALQEAVESLKGELAEAKEAGEAAAKDAARAAQVLSDLGEQVRCPSLCVYVFYVCIHFRWLYFTRVCVFESVCTSHTTHVYV